MGNQIGNYIHYFYSNYLLYGTARKLSQTLGGGERGNLWELVEQERNKIKISNEDKKIKELEKNLQNIMSPNGGKKQQQESEKLRNAIVAYMEGMVSGVKAEHIDFEKMSLTPQGIKFLSEYGASRMLNTLEDPLTRKALIGKYLGKGDSYKKGTILKHINQLKLILEKIPEDFEDKNLYEAKADLDKTLKDIEKRIIQYTSGYITKDKESKNLVDEINKVAKQMLTLKQLSLVKGHLGEAFLAAAGLSLSSSINKGVDQSLNELIKGDKGAHIAYDKKKTVGLDTILDDRYHKEYQSEELSWIINTNPNVQGKIDVQVQMDDGEDLNISVKNYNFNTSRENDIKLVSESNLLYLLQSSAQFVNHYLNQASIRDESRWKAISDQRRANAPEAKRDEANDALKKMIAIKAFAGGGLRTDALSEKYAQIIAINDSSGKYGFKITTINSLYNKIINSGIQNSLNFEPDNFYTFKNYYGSSEASRINNLVGQLKKAKVTVYLRMSWLKNNIQKL